LSGFIKITLGFYMWISVEPQEKTLIHLSYPRYSKGFRRALRISLFYITFKILLFHQVLWKLSLVLLKLMA